MGLQDAVNEIQLEIEYTKGYPVLNEDEKHAHIISCSICKNHINSLIEATSNNL
jgi:hypothetical protein